MVFTEVPLDRHMPVFTGKSLPCTGKKRSCGYPVPLSKITKQYPVLVNLFSFSCSLSESSPPASQSLNTEQAEVTPYPVTVKVKKRFGWLPPDFTPWHLYPLPLPLPTPLPPSSGQMDCSIYPFNWSDQGLCHSVRGTRMMQDWKLPLHCHVTVFDVAYSLLFSGLLLGWQVTQI